MSEIKVAARADVPAIMEIMHAAHAAMTDPTAYIIDSEDYVTHYIQRDGFILLAMEQGQTVGFFMAAAPGISDHNLGYYLDYNNDQLRQTLMMDSSAVLPQHQGRGIMSMLFAEAVSTGKEKYRYLLGTVAPDNTPSLRCFQKNGFTAVKSITKPTGHKRLLMLRDCLKT